MARPDVSIALSNNRLGRTPPSLDGVCGLVVSGVAVGGQFALGDVLGPFRSIKDVEAKGITSAYDITNTCMAWHHANAFYEEVNAAAQLYMVVVAKTALMSARVSATSGAAKTLIETTAGKVRFVGVTREPDGAYTPTYTGQIEDDILLAITAAQALAVDQFALHRPVRIVLEGRNFQGTIGSLTDLRDNGANSAVAVVLGQDKDVALENAAFAKHANVGRVLGRMAAIRVHENIGKRKTGATTIESASLSDGTLISAISSANLDTVYEKGYIFATPVTDLPGFYFVDDPVATAITDDYSSLSAGRVIDKAARIAYTAYVLEIQNNVEIDASTGKLPLAVCKAFESMVESAISTGMAGEVSGVNAYVDPDQNILQDNVLAVEVSVVPQGTIKNFSVSLGFALSLAQ